MHSLAVNTYGACRQAGARLPTWRQSCFRKEQHSQQHLTFGRWAVSSTSALLASHRLSMGSFSELVRLILHADYSPLPDASPEFAHLVARLLDKNPATRMTWAEMLTHPFWQFTLPVTPMPPEPALERYIARHNLAPKQHESGGQEQIEDKKAYERAKLCATTPLLPN